MQISQGVYFTPGMIISAGEGGGGGGGGGCVEPSRLIPFPYSSYYIPAGSNTSTTYYNNPALDAVSLKMTLGGDSAAWADSASYYDLGLKIPAVVATSDLEDIFTSVNVFFSDDGEGNFTPYLNNHAFKIQISQGIIQVNFTDYVGYDGYVDDSTAVSAINAAISNAGHSSIITAALVAGRVTIKNLNNAPITILAGSEPSYNVAAELGFITGVPYTSTDVTPISVSGGIYDPDIQELDLVNAQLFEINNSTQLGRYSDANQKVTGPGAGVTIYPGVASLPGFSSSYYNYVKCLGRPISYELEFICNTSKNSATNPSGYFNLGDFQGVNECPRIWSHNASGHYQRYMIGLIKDTATAATANISDIMLGILVTGNGSGGNSYLCINGNVVASGSLGEAITDVAPTFIPDTTIAVASLGDFPQSFDYFDIDIEGSTTNNFISFDSGDASADQLKVDTFKTKWAWHVDYVADAGEGTDCGNIEWVTPSVFTHPGF